MKATSCSFGPDALNAKELGNRYGNEAVAGLHPTAMTFVADRRVAALGSDGNSDTAPSTTQGVAFPITCSRSTRWECTSWTTWPSRICVRHVRRRDDGTSCSSPHPCRSAEGQARRSTRSRSCDTPRAEESRPVSTDSRSTAAERARRPTLGRFPAARRPLRGFVCVGARPRRRAGRTSRRELLVRPVRPDVTGPIRRSLPTTLALTARTRRYQGSVATSLPKELDAARAGKQEQTS